MAEISQKILCNQQESSDGQTTDILTADKIHNSRIVPHQTSAHINSTRENRGVALTGIPNTFC